MIEITRYYVIPSDAPETDTRILSLLRLIQTGISDIKLGIDDLKAGQQRILARFDASEQRILAPLLARLDEKQTAVVAAVLDALDGRAFPAAELEEHLAAIRAALAEINARSAEMADRQLAVAVQHATAVVGDPDLAVKHKLKVTIPILPALIAYEGELELGSQLNLRELWRALRGWVKGG